MERLSVPHSLNPDAPAPPPGTLLLSSFRRFSKDIKVMNSSWVNLAWSLLGQACPWGSWRDV